ARIILGPEMSIQAPPNLSPGALERLVAAGINDWGGVSPVTPDHVNPEAAWPHLELLRDATARAGKQLVARLPLYPRYVEGLREWVDPGLHRLVLERVDATGFARTDDWHPGDREAPLPRPAGRAVCSAGTGLMRVIDKARSGRRLEEGEILLLFSSRGGDFERVCQAADELRQEVNGDRVSYVVNRNINYTNICYFGCRFCAFSKGRVRENLRERGYLLSLEEIRRRVREARARGATEVCLQGGIHPDFTGETYLQITRAVRKADPDIHIHAFSPLEVSHGAQTLGLPVGEFLGELKRAGLGTLPGTAAEILDDEIRSVICPDKLDTREWLQVVRAAHEAGLNTTATIMFGHVESPRHWARHLLRVRDLQAETGGFTEFVPLPYVHMQAPLSLKGLARPGPTYRETVLMHAVARLVLHPLIVNIQASWVKLGPEVLKSCLSAGVNDLGGTLMNESISRAAGAGFGQELPPEQICAIVRQAGRRPVQRNTLYGEVDGDRRNIA
ncbi:MAG: 7,8-didemethyl-8-hydroxy-5-deazariboflavin synthase subunit CofH, partial [Gammaproteobacteria bacterium]